MLRRLRDSLEETLKSSRLPASSSYMISSPATQSERAVLEVKSMLIELMEYNYKGSNSFMQIANASTYTKGLSAEPKLGSFGY